jgi:hypothetical protein
MLDALLALATFLAPPPAAAPAENPYAASVQVALADARRIGAESFFTLYLSLPPTVPEADLEEWKTGLDLWANSLSREPVLVKLRRVSKTLLAANIVAYGWDREVVGRLADADPYYHVRADLAVAQRGRKFYYQDGATKAGWYNVEAAKAIRVTALAPWTLPAEHAELVALTNLPGPILRADWFFAQLGIQAGRQVGYYDFLGVKSRDDFHKLVGLDQKESERVKRRIRAIVRRSGVGNFPRQIERLQSLTGGYWYTLDQIDNNLDQQNALRQLNKDLKHKAEEHYGVLPNGLYAYLLSDDKGTRQDSAPDGIGFDRTAPGNDGKIHVGISCFRCHTEGLRPINDWARRVFNGPVKLASPDPVEYQKLVQLYLDDLQTWVDDDTSFYAKRLKRLTGWKTDEAAKAVGRMWAWYVEADILPADAAAELGLTEEVYLKRLRDYFKDQAKAGLPSDNVLASHIGKVPEPIRRDDWEQLQSLVLPVVLGAPK